jgi:hypothetical protein
MNIEIRKIKNGYIMTFGKAIGKDEYAYDNIIELFKMISDVYDESQVAQSILEYCERVANEEDKE